MLNATAALIEEVPYPRLTIEAIAARAGVGKQTIYRWWPSRGAIVFDSLLERSGGADASLPDSGDLQADLSAFLRASADEMASPSTGAFLRAVTVEILQDDGVAQQYRDRLLTPQRSAVRRRLAVSQDAGMLRDDLDLDVLVECLLGPLVGRWLLGPGPLEVDFADAVVDVALRGAIR